MRHAEGIIAAVNQLDKMKKTKEYNRR